MQNLPLPAEPLTEFQKFVAATTGQLLPIYGAKLFRNVPSTFSPNDLAPVTSTYVIGPDDELRIRIWGQINYSGNLRVDRSGDVYLPQVGAISVAGLQFSSLDQHLRSAIGKVFRNFDLSVDMGRIRSIQVYVTGQARRPGVYTVSSLSTLVDALFASGGPSAQGSLRHVELRRNGQTVADFDLYGFLIHGDKSKDVRLLPEDVLFIPPTGAQVAITGSVHNPAIYEIRNGGTLADLIDAAGKTTAVASSGRISLERIGEQQVRQAMEFPFTPTGLSTPLADGDIVRVFSVVPSYRQTVTLRGDVANPGRFAWHSGMHLSDLIPDRDSLLSRDYWWKRSHLGLPGPEFEPLISDFEMNRKRPNRTDNSFCNPNLLNPNVANPNGQDQSAPGYACGNSYNPNGNSTILRNRQLYNPDPTSPEAQDALTSDLAASDRLDAVNYDANSRDSHRAESGGTVASEFGQMQGSANPTATRRTEVKLSAPEIDWNYAVIERLDPQDLKTSLVSFDLGKLVIDHDASQNLALQPGDVITIFSQADIRVPLEEQTKYVRLEGEFLHAGVYSVHPGETLRDLVQRAGGFTSKAYLYGSEFDRESTRVLQQQRIDEYVRRVDLDASRGTLALTASATTSAGTAANTSAATAAEQQLLLRLKEIRATGRVVLNFQPDRAIIDDVPMIALENGDRFTVPPTPATVNVVGAVYDQNSFLYHDGSSAGHYLRIAGGPDRDADWRHTFVIRADGSVVAREAVKGPWGNAFKNMKLYPGDTIIVPDKTLRPTALRGLLDWTQIFSQLAIGAAAVEVLRQ
ncbi:MAG TPA: SLBB domain-containing protein [Acidobacteriaceae bacterium]|jgi:protein involved in polysaccharide export with SLBB domain|nr:SLBB domain-containing protein [Acidobacteriaceae bacterium]